MPRKPRIDAPDCIYHVIARGIERRQIFNDDEDRCFFISRLGRILTATATPAYAFALIPNHFHLLLRRGKVPIAKVMQRLLTAYAVHFNNRHKRSGHLFQNRYKAIVCQEDRYFLELVRYIHLNPVRAGIVTSLSELGRYGFCGHSYIMGKRHADWFAAEAVLPMFATRQRAARKGYEDFVSQALGSRGRDDLEGGGLKRSLAGASQSEKADRQAYDDQVLGQGVFVEELQNRESDCSSDLSDEISLLFLDICSRFAITEKQLCGGGRARDTSRARASLVRRLTGEYGLPQSEVASLLAISPAAVCKIVARKDS